MTVLASDTPKKKIKYASIVFSQTHSIYYERKYVQVPTLHRTIARLLKGSCEIENLLDGWYKTSVISDEVDNATIAPYPKGYRLTFLAGNYGGLKVKSIEIFEKGNIPLSMVLHELDCSTKT